MKSIKEFDQNQASKEAACVQNALKNDDFTQGNNNFVAESVQICGIKDAKEPNLQQNVKIDDFSTENVQISAVSEESILTNPQPKSSATDQVSELECNCDLLKSDKNAIFSITEEEKSVFQRLFPGISAEKVLNDSNFKVFAEGKDKKANFCETYSNYAEFVRKIAEEAVFRAKVAQSNKQASPGALGSAESNNNSYFTKEQVKKMTRDQIAQNYNIIRQSQQKW